MVVVVLTLVEAGKDKGMCVRDPEGQLYAE